ncbi:MAG: hypothetical protein Tsb0013_07060 [Phycisphaerales bacterium]
MAKMFYSLSEAAQKLGKSEADVRQMAQNGEITEFRDGDNLIFKVDQIDLLAGDDDAGSGSDGDSMIPLADTGLGGSGTGMGLADSSGGSGASGGISIFDADEVEEADPGAVTQITDLQGSGEALDAVSLESFGSGSGLMDLTRDAGDDTAAGMGGVLDDIYSSPDSAGETVGETGLFEGAASAAELETAPASGAGALPEAMDPKFSGLSGGLMFGALLTTIGAIAMVLMSAIGFVPEAITGFMDGNVLIMMGIAAGVTGLCGLVGFFVGGKG